MSASTLWQRGRWQIVLPERVLTEGHLTIVSTGSASLLDRDDAEDLVDSYRRVRAALWKVGGYRGFMISFAVGWRPDAAGIGEPDPIDDSLAIHVFGRGPQDPLSPVRVMGSPRADRRYVSIDPVRIAALAAALATAAEIEVPAPSIGTGCDGCSAEVLNEQERWRADGVRVIRPRRVIIDAQVLMLPLRHVVSIGDLTPAEVGSMAARLDEVRDQFRLASGATGLSCFANDGTAAGQETPHVHLHVFGRSRGEAVNPFELLAHRHHAASGRFDHAARDRADLARS